MCAQLIDIRIYHFWKKLTKGKHLWLRNNCSTIFSQLIDTFLIIFSFFVMEVQSSGINLVNFFYMDLPLKIIIAIIDTPLIYLAVFYLRKKFKLKIDQELK